MLKIGVTIEDLVESILYTVKINESSLNRAQKLVSDFFDNLNRKGLLTVDETKNLTEKAHEELWNYWFRNW